MVRARDTREDRYTERDGEDREYSNRDWEVENAPSDPERRRKFRERWAQTYLPNLPTKPGWHRCWVNSKHSTDTVPSRIARGYQLVKAEDLKTQGWNYAEYNSDRDAGTTSDGNVHWREMIAMEIPEDMYQEAMREFHHDEPYEMARDIMEPFTDGEVNGRIREAGGRIDMAGGSKDMIRFRRPPRQFE